MDPIVLKLLEYLTPSEGSTSVINTTLLHENDRNRIKAFFKLLREWKIPFNSIEIEKWLLNSNGWPEKRVIKQVMKIVQNINNDKRIQIRDRKFWIKEAKKWIVTWKKEVEENKYT